jgi:hypothetical protein
MNAWKITKDRIELNLEQLLQVGVVLYEAGLIEKDVRDRHRLCLGR